MTLKKFGDLEVGDYIPGSDGKPVMVSAAYDEHIPDRMFEIETETGQLLKVSGNHLWYVETNFDYSYHNQRRKECRKVLKSLSNEAIENMLGIILHPDEIETGLADMISLCDYTFDDREAVAVFSRIALSIGHVSETSKKYRDLLTNEDVYTDSEHVKSYDAKEFCKQVLSATGLRKFRKQWNLIIGRVVTTEEMLEYDVSEIHIPDSNFKNLL